MVNTKWMSSNNTKCMMGDAKMNENMKKEKAWLPFAIEKTTLANCTHYETGFKFQISFFQ